MPPNYDATANLIDLLEGELLDARPSLAFDDLEPEVLPRLVRAVTTRRMPPPKVPMRPASPIHVRIKESNRGFHVTAVHRLQRLGQSGQYLVHTPIVAAANLSVKLGAAIR